MAASIPTLLTGLLTGLPTLRLLRALCSGFIIQPQREADALTIYIHLHDLHLDHLAGTHHRVRVIHKRVRHGGHVHQSVLMYTHIHERTESGNVGHSTFQNHAGLQVRDLLHSFFEGGRGEFGAGVAAGLIQLGDDVGDGGDSELVGSKIRRVQSLKHAGIADQFRHSQARRSGNRPHHRICLRVHR